MAEGYPVMADKKPIATVDRPDLRAAAAYLTRCGPAGRTHARALERIACVARAQHKNLGPDSHCGVCGTTRVADQVRP